MSSYFFAALALTRPNFYREVVVVAQYGKIDGGREFTLSSKMKLPLIYDRWHEEIRTVHRKAESFASLRPVMRSAIWGIHSTAKHHRFNLHF